jgi:hypothetical protein
MISTRLSENFEPLRARRGLIDRWSLPTTTLHHHPRRISSPTRAKEMGRRFAGWLDHCKPVFCGKPPRCAVI